MLHTVVACVLILAIAGVDAEKVLTRQKRQWIENECNGPYVETTASTGELHHWRYPNGYRRGFCRWRIQAPENTRIRVEIDFVETSCRRRDYLRVVDGSGFVHINNMCGNQRPEPFTSISNEIRVNFRARRNNSRRRGFFLTYYMEEEQGPSDDACVAPGRLLEETSGEVTSQGYEDDGQGSYSDNSDCRWKIDVGGDNNILLTFERFSVERDPGCRYDWLAIYDGPDASARRLARYCGTGSLPEIKSTGSSLYLHFFSDGSVTANGFKFLWTMLEAGTPNDGSYLGCGDSANVVTGSSGEITSPNYNSAYPPESECSHKIVTAAGSVVQVTLEELDIELGNECEFDSLTLFDGPGPSSDMLFNGPICGNIVPVIPASTTNEVFVVFESDATQEADGFRLTWTEQVAPMIQGQPCTESGQVIASRQGSIMSQGFDDGGYSNDANCKWRIRAPEGGQVVLRWNEIDIEDASGCSYDVLQVHDGSGADAKVMRRYCGQINNASPIKSTGRDLFLNLKTDDSVTENGFSATFETFEGGIPDPGTAPGCGGGPPAQLTSGSYELASPSYDGSTPYGSNAQCAWQITASEGKHIQINFRNVDMEYVEECRADSIKVYSGTGATHSASAIECGSPADFSVSVRGNQAYVTFTSDLTVAGTGFQATWEEVEPQPVTCGNPSVRVKSKTETNQRIYGGSEANPFSLPWQVLLLSRNGFTCGGSILSEEWVVTAAHCVENGLSIVAGVHDRTKSETSQQSIQVAEVHVHPNYANYDSDIALLRLAQPLVFNDNVKAVCLAQDSAADGTDCITSGWGQQENGRVSDTLQQVYLPLVNQAVCRDLIGSSMTDNMICAGQPQGGIDACSGDSGGPLVCQGASGEWVLHGITSWGYGCAEAGLPGLWTRVTNYQTWIQQITDNAALFGGELPAP